MINERRATDATTPFVIPKRKAIFETIAGASQWRPGRRYEYDQAWPQDGERDGIYLHQKETVIKKEEPLMSEIRTGSELPYLCTERNVLDFGSSAHERSMLLDDQRIVLVKVSKDTGVWLISSVIQRMILIQRRRKLYVCASRLWRLWSFSTCQCVMHQYAVPLPRLVVIATYPWACPDCIT